MRDKNLFFYERNRCERNRKNWVRVVEKCARFCVSVRFLRKNRSVFASHFAIIGFEQARQDSRRQWSGSRAMSSVTT
jgi:hypothetical protein